MRPELVFRMFLAVWIALLGAVSLFYWKGSLATKRRFHPYVVAGGALIFLGFVTVVMPPSTFVVIAPVVALVSFLNYKITKFCNGCGATVIQPPPWREPPTCTKCGMRVGPPS
jgi:hypothetical protein